MSLKKSYCMRTEPIEPGDADVLECVADDTGYSIGAVAEAMFKK